MASIEKYRSIVAQASTDTEQAELVAKALQQAEDAKQLLRNAGFGVTGTSLLETVKEALSVMN